MVEAVEEAMEGAMEGLVMEQEHLQLKSVLGLFLAFSCTV